MIKNILPYSLLAVFISIFFYFDKGLMIGVDNAYFLDLSFMISQGGKFLQDFFDYRFPVLPLIFSPIFKLGLNDFINRYLLLAGVYTFYSFVLYYAAYLISRSQRTALVVSLLTFVSITARQYDPFRHICFPIFSHTLELLSVTILLGIFLDLPSGIDSRKSKWYALAAGAFFALAFISRQIHFSSPILLTILIALFVLFRIFKGSKGVFRNLNWQEIKIIFAFYCLGAAVSGGLLLFFFISQSGSISLIQVWLFDFPKLFYPIAASSGWLLERINTVALIELPEWRNKILPVFGMTYFALLISTIALLLTLKTKDRITVKLDYLFANNVREIIFIISIALIAVVPVFIILISRRSDPGFFSLYAILLAYLLSAFLFKRETLRTLVIFLPVFLYLCFLFISRELPSYAASIRLMHTEKYDEKVAKAIIRAAKGEKKYIVLFLGGHPPTVVRLTGYSPFMGLIGDGGYYVLPKLFGKSHENIISEKLREVNIIYKGFDYPNLSFGADEDANNRVYLMFEDCLHKNFRISEIVQRKGIYPNNDCYPIAYDNWPSKFKGVVVYERMRSEKLEID